MSSYSRSIKRQVRETYDYHRYSLYQDFLYGETVEQIANREGKNNKAVRIIITSAFLANYKKLSHEDFIFTYWRVREICLLMYSSHTTSVRILEEALNMEVD